MIGRRVAAYFIDLLVFSAVSILSIVLGGLITNSFSESVFLRILISIPLFIIFIVITSGILGVLTRGSIGKKLMDLKVSSTMGFVTAFRLTFRDLAKYIAFVPVLIGVFMLFENRIEHIDLFMLTIKISGAMLVLLVLFQSYVFFKHKQMFADMVFFTKVENDIPNAVEYDDILEFIEQKDKIKK